MKTFNHLIITTLLCLLLLPSCGSKKSEKQEDSDQIARTSTPIKEEILQCPLDFANLEEELSFEAILRGGKAILRIPQTVREKILNFYPIENMPIPPFQYATNEEYEVSGLADKCEKIVFINIGQHWDNPMLYFITKDGGVKILSFLRAIYYNDFIAIQHPAVKGFAVDVISRDEATSGYRSAFAILKDGQEVELEIAYTRLGQPEVATLPDGSPKTILVATQDFRIFFVTKNKNGLWQEALVGTFVSHPGSQEAADVLDYHFTLRKTYGSEAQTPLDVDMRGTMLGEWEQYNESDKYMVTSRDNTAPFERKRTYSSPY